MSLCGLCVFHTWFLSSKGSFFASFTGVSTELSSRTVARKVFSPLQSLTSVFGMGTGGPSAFVALTFLSLSNSPSLNIEQQFLFLLQVISRHLV